MAYSADFFDISLDNVSGPKPFLGVTASANALGRAGGNNIAWLEGDALANIGNKVGNIKEHVLGIRLLLHLAIYFKPEIECLWVGDFVGCDNTWAKWCVGVHALRINPLSRSAAIARADV